VTREFYYNDAGAQIRNLGLSVQARIREKLGFESRLPRRRLSRGLRAPKSPKNTSRRAIRTERIWKR